MSSSTYLRAMARGAVGAMAMTGMRQLTSNIGLLREAPPESMVSKVAPDELRRLSPEKRTALTEVTHWTYGSLAGVGFALLPSAVRRWWPAGPLYGVGVWLGYETVIAPLLGLEAPHGKVLGRIAVLGDHVLYGAVVGARATRGAAG